MLPATSGNTGIITANTGSVLTLKDVTGTGVFIDGRELTGSDSGATADVNVSTKNADSNFTHDLNTPLSNLIVKVMISTDGTDNNSFEAGRYADDGSYGLNVSQVDADNILIQTSTLGILIIQGNGTIYAVNTDDYYYKIQAWKLG